MKRLSIAFLVSLFLVPSAHVSYSQSTSIKVIKKINLPGDGKWDFVTFDEASRRLYVSHGTSMQVVDMEQEKLVGQVPNTPGIHGIAVVPEVNKGFTSNGKDSTVTVFDLTTFATIKVIKIPGASPDHIIFDSFSKQVFVFNNKSSDVSVINPSNATLVNTFPLGGKPELAVSDEKGLVFVNLEDKHEIVVFDAKTFAIKNRWSLLPGEEPTGLALDIKNQRLFSTCSNKKMVVLNAVTGKVITTLPIGDKVDGVAYDPAEKRIYTSNGEGTVTVIKQEDQDKYVVLENVATKKGAKTLAFDVKKHRVYIPSADYTPVAATTENPTPKPTITPNTFGILVVGK